MPCFVVCTFFTQTFILFLFENIAYFVDNFYFFLC